MDDRIVQVFLGIYRYLDTDARVSRKEFLVKPEKKPGFEALLKNLESESPEETKRRKLKVIQWLKLVYRLKPETRLQRIHELLATYLEVSIDDISSCLES